MPEVTDPFKDCECGKEIEKARGLELIERDGWMCEKHAGVEWPHGDCPGPGMPWVIEGKEQILALKHATPVN